MDTEISSESISCYGMVFQGYMHKEQGLKWNLFN